MSPDRLKQRLQDHLTDGLVLVVGSGLSLAEGVPGMGALAAHLRAEVPPRCDKDSELAWGSIAKDLDSGLDLETTLLRNAPDSRLESLIMGLTAEFIGAAERRVIDEVISGDRILRFSRLLAHLLKPNSGIPVITTNYDRLIEVATEMAGLGVDSLFAGSYVGRFDSKESRLSLCRSITQRRKVVHLSYANHVVLLKPHGSLDWFLRDGDPVRSSLVTSGQRLMITPGANKFRGGYERPFDAHRERANKEIDTAGRFLIIGYGFNDDHLQTHLEHQLRKGTPAVLLCRSLTAKAKQLASTCPNVLALSESASKTGTHVLGSVADFAIDGVQLWDIGNLISEVLEP